jgi:very-long-chain (3R)-3-hydroxyacyl-CoA dehydratase
VRILQGVQLFQISDIILILIGLSKGSVFGAFMQILGRNVVSLLFISAESDRLRFATVAIIWAMADVNRYLYYLFKKNPITGFLRYNSFILLYPLGVYGEMLIINDYIKRNAAGLSDNEINVIRLVQVLIIGGMVYLYSYMLSSRKKYYKSLQVESGKPS